MHFTEHAQLWDTDWWASYLMSSHSTHQNNQTASSSSHCCFIFFIFFCCCCFWIWTRIAQSLKSDSVYSLSREAGVSPKRKATTTLHMARSCHHRWTCARSLVLSLGGWRGAATPSGLNPVPPESAASGLRESGSNHYWLQVNLWLRIYFAACL